MLLLRSARSILTFLCGLLYFAILCEATTKVKLPCLLGPHKVGTKRLEITDHSRRDPWVPTEERTLILQLFYPIKSAEDLIPAPWLPPNASAFADQTAELPPGTVFAINTRIHSGGTAIFPLEKSHEIPVLVYSPGFFAVSATATSVLSSLASYGYTIVAVDHTYESFPLERLSGELVFPLSNIEDIRKVVSVRKDDVTFVSKQLSFSKLCEWLPSAHDCKNRHTRHQEKLSLSLGIMGTSLGGNTAALAMQDPKSLYKASASLDGPFVNVSLTPEHPLRGPLLYLAASNSCCTDLLTATWPSIKGWKLAIEINGTAHVSFSDLVTVKPQLPNWKFPNENLPNINLSDVGTIDDERMNDIVVVYLREFWEWTLLGRRKGNLLKKESQKFPDVKFLDLK
jgi:hypothetical protein